MPLGSLTRAGALRAAAVAVITATVWAVAACSDEDLVDTIPPPRPNRTTTTDEQTTTPAITPATTSPTSSATSSATTASTPAGPTTSASQL